MCFKLRRLGAYKVKESGGMPQYEAGSDGKCFNIRQGVRGMHQYSLGVRGMPYKW